MPNPPSPMLTAAVDLTGSGDKTLIPSAADTHWVVHQVYLCAQALMTIIPKSGATPLSGPIKMTAGTQGALTLPYSDTGWWACVGSNDPFVISKSDADRLSGMIVYRIYPNGHDH